MKNQSRDFATMTDEERRRFALENPTEAEAAELNIPPDGPRDADRMGRDYQKPGREFADPEHRDGRAAQLDDEQHERNVDDA